MGEPFEIWPKTLGCNFLFPCVQIRLLQNNGPKTWNGKSTIREYHALAQIPVALNFFFILTLASVAFPSPGFSLHLPLLPSTLYSKNPILPIRSTTPVAGKLVRFIHDAWLRRIECRGWVQHPRTLSYLRLLFSPFFMLCYFAKFFSRSSNFCRLLLDFEFWFTMLAVTLSELCFHFSYNHDYWNSFEIS